MTSSVEGMKKGQDQESMILAEILEAVISSQIELSDWLGSGVRTRGASLYDDYKNGIDAVAEIEREETREQFAIAFDVTQTEFHMAEKIKRIKREIDEGTLTTIEYYEDSDGSRKVLEKRPRVILGLDRDHVAELSALWVNGRKKELANHPVQFVLLEEIRTQLEIFRDYARDTGKEDIAKTYDNELSIFEEIIEEKKELKDQVDFDDYRADRVARIIGVGARRLLSTTESRSADQRRRARGKGTRDAVRKIRRSY